MSTKTTPVIFCPVCAGLATQVTEQSNHRYPDAGPDDFVVIAGRRFRARSIVGDTWWFATPCGCAITEAQFQSVMEALGA